MAEGRLKTEDFRGDPRSESSVRGFIGFGEEGGMMIEYGANCCEK